MSRKKREDQSVLDRAGVVAEQCECLPLVARTLMLSIGHQDEGNEEIVPASPRLKQELQTLLEELFPRSTPLGLLLLHLAQREPRTLLEGELREREPLYHAAPMVLEQVVVNVRRAVRSDDQVMIHDRACAAILFPGVDLQGMQKILDRVNRNIDLLQAETMIPPLTRETVLVMGIGSASGESGEALLLQTGHVARSFVLRPVISSETWDEGCEPIGLDHEVQGQHLAKEPALIAFAPRSRAKSKAAKLSARYPFMQLPAELPARLKQLIPYQTACTLRCAPVGRDHHSLTVAMEDPLNGDTLRHLQEVTGMSIFPVTCEKHALDALLAHKW